MSPNILELNSDEAKNNWFQGYITTLIQKDVKDLSNIEQIAALPNILKLLADRIERFFGFLIENFVVLELKKQMTWAKTEIKI